MTTTEHSRLSRLPIEIEAERQKLASLEAATAMHRARLATLEDEQASLLAKRRKETP